MTRLDEASTTRPRFVRDPSPPPALSEWPIKVFDVDISPKWCVGSTAHGGVLVNILVDAALRRQASCSSPHNDPAHLSAQFLTATIPGKATVEVKVVSESKRWTRLAVELFQWTPDVNTTFYLDAKTQRTVRIQAHLLVTNLPEHPPLEAGFVGPTPDGGINFLSRPCPLLVHPSNIDMSDGGDHIPEKLMFREGIRWKDVDVDKSDGSLASGSWVELIGGEDVTLSAVLVAFFADVAKNGPSMLPADLRPAVSWYPTMSFALDFKSKFPLKLSSTAASSSGFSRRTFGIYSETKAIHEGRHDLTVEVWAVDGELGVGPPRKEEIGADGVAKWRREGARLVGVSTQMALSLSIAVNHSRGKTPPTAAGESDSTRKQARL
ncbi:hypothetical protein C6P46_003512 [Rhodotorula mucilaginosa]|uniref:Acyl-CoA thioesterase-like N-terminal HotDog domain-containing protein n=1 Tax=Rhodotorula mucilaginosa TaxID=5537 RepID=A0A9P6W2I8_RHOMI|nr:hypothetical protein C6P46_003512 [Rhodotorula mucilaginosa]TKA58108.1 hypothetical protein B0A53_00510 [Rhodotorula sp. CCFEE 5036]